MLAQQVRVSLLMLAQAYIAKRECIRALLCTLPATTERFQPLIVYEAKCKSYI